MTTQFVDTHYLLALINTSDQYHAAAVKHGPFGVSKLVTTTWVLVEFADALCSVRSRANAAKFIRSFISQKFVEVVAPSLPQFENALELYELRPDKSWSLTDCISFELMKQHGIQDALTGDHHFEQAGFRALLLDSHS
jgi:predicted nucleic acid-binding protein